MKVAVGEVERRRPHRWRCLLCTEHGPAVSGLDALAEFEKHYAQMHKPEEGR